MKKLKKTVTTTIVKTVIEQYALAKDLLYVRTIVNDRDVSNRLEYRGKNINAYHIQPMYNPDLSLLKVWNPFWGENKELGLNKDYSWFKFELPENPEDIDIKDVIYVGSASHSFFDINLDPLPVVIRGDYIEASLHNKSYRLKELKEYFDSHPNIVSCSEILEIPYYNADNGRSKYLDVLVLPEKEWLIDMYANKKSRREVFTSTYDTSHPDYLNTRQFMKPIVEDED